jgi:hypothetical protein
MHQSVRVSPEQVAEGLNDTAETFLAAIANNESEVAPSSIYAAAAVLEGVPFINGSPQNTFVPGLIELAVQRGAPPSLQPESHFCRLCLGGSRPCSFRLSSCCPQGLP